MMNYEPKDDDEPRSKFLYINVLLLSIVPLKFHESYDDW